MALMAVELCYVVLYYIILYCIIISPSDSVDMPPATLPSLSAAKVLHASHGLAPQEGAMSRRIPALDGFRAVAIGLVILGHLFPTLGIKLPSRYAALFSVGGLGVRVFFVISGFLITSILLQELDDTGAVSVVRFYFRRTLRIFPAYYTYVVIIWLLVASGWVTTGPHELRHALTYTINYCTTCTWVLGHAWSLSVEEQFYLLWPVAFILAGTRRRLVVALAPLIVCPILRSGGILVPVYLSGSSYRFELVADSLATGCILAQLRSLTGHPWLAQPLRSPMFFLVPILVLLIEWLGAFPSLIPSWIYQLLCISAQNILIAVCVLWGISLVQTSLSYRVLNHPATTTIGKMSYSIYLWQQLFFNQYADHIVNRVPYSIIATAAAATISYYAVEQPFLRLRASLEHRIFTTSPPVSSVSG
jgi:peptidoglycan/LPS O-acetylase OafA/YrhL